MDGDLNTWRRAIEQATAATAIAHAAERDGRLAEMQSAVRDAKVVREGGNVGQADCFRSGGTVMLDFNLNIERWCTMQSDRNDFFAIHLD